MRRILLVAAFCCLPHAMFADDASVAWRKVLQKCAKTEVIGSRSAFFGVSNTAGPGSVWRFTSDKSLRLLFELSDAIPSSADQAKMITEGNIATCAGNASSSWDLKIGLPFSTGPISADIAAVLGRAKRVVVSVDGYAVDMLKETNWKRAFRSLGPEDDYLKEVNQEGRVLAENVVKVTGFRVTFSFGTNLSADIQAKFKGKSFNLGQDSSRGNGKPANGADAGSKAAQTPAPATGKNSKTDSKSAEASGAPSGSKQGCAAGNSAAQAAGPNAAAGGGSGTPGAATLHADISRENEITLCAAGPFYIIAAYSKLVGGQPVGISNTDSLPLALVPVDIPEGITARIDRDPQTRK